MEERTLRGLQFIAVQLVGAVAVIHFAVGSEQLAGIVANGLLAEYLGGRFLERPRALLFVVSSVCILAGLTAAGRGQLDRRTAYQLGLLVMAIYLVGWVAWHTVLDHGLALAAGDGAASGGTDHHAGLLDTLYSHYIEPLLATIGAAAGERGSARTLLGIVAVTLELMTAAILTILLRHDPAAAEGGIDRRVTTAPDSETTEQ